MEIGVTEQDGINILSLSGRMDATTTPEFESAGRALLAEGKTQLVVDMAELEDIRSAGPRGRTGPVQAI